MALTRTHQGRWRSANSFGTGAFTTGSFTPPSSSLLVVVAHFIEDSGTTDPSGDLTIADSVGLTWTSRALIGNASTWSSGMRAWTAPVTTGASMTVSLDCGSRNAYVYVADVIAYTDYNSSSPVGATATDGAMVLDGADSLTLSGSPASTSEVVASIFVNFDVAGTADITAGTGWTELEDSQDADRYTISQTQVRAGSTSATVGWDDVFVGSGSVFKTTGLAIEIKENAGGASIVPHARFMLTGIG